MSEPGISAAAIPRAWITPAVAAAAAGWGAQQFTPLLGVYHDRLHLTDTMTQPTFAAYTMGLLPGLPLGVPFSDRFGRKAVMVPTVLAAAPASVPLVAGPYRRFLMIVAPPAPWVFMISAGVSLTVLGLLVAAEAVHLRSPALTLISGLAPGVAYGCLQVCGLLEVQQVADPAHLGGLTAVYQALSYIGFAASFVLALSAPMGSPVHLLLYTTALAALFFLWLLRAQRILAPEVRTEARAGEPTTVGAIPRDATRERI